MRTYAILLSSLLIFVPNSLGAQNTSPAQGSELSPRKVYIATYEKMARKEMKRTGVPASITLAQGILESGNGQSRLATEGNNHFGIKCHEGWKGKTMFVDDDKPDECFRVYRNPKQSFVDHSEFLLSRSRYDGLFILDPRDYQSWAKGLTLEMRHANCIITRRGCTSNCPQPLGCNPARKEKKRTWP